MGTKLPLITIALLAITVGCVESDDDVAIQTIQDSGEGFRAETEINRACALIPLTGEAWVDTKMPMLNGEAGAAQITEDAYANFLAVVLASYSALSEIDPSAFEDNSASDKSIGDEIQWELAKLSSALEGMADFNQSSNFPVYFPPNNAGFLDDFNTFCDGFLPTGTELSDGTALPDGQPTEVAEESSAESSTRADATVEISEEELLGKTLDEVQETLAEKGLRLDAITGNLAPSENLVSTVYRVRPQGTVASNTIISVYFYAAIP